MTTPITSQDLQNLIDSVNEHMEKVNRDEQLKRKPKICPRPVAVISYRERGDFLFPQELNTPYDIHTQEARDEMYMKGVMIGQRAHAIIIDEGDRMYAVDVEGMAIMLPVIVFGETANSSDLLAGLLATGVEIQVDRYIHGRTERDWLILPKITPNGITRHPMQTINRRNHIKRMGGLQGREWLEKDVEPGINPWHNKPGYDV
jgi:hypothetical protein